MWREAAAPTQSGTDSAGKSFLLLAQTASGSPLIHTHTHTHTPGSAVNMMAAVNPNFCEFLMLFSGLNYVLK